MLVKDKNGREIEITVRGTYEEPLIDEAHYVDGPDVDVPDDDLYEIEQRYASELSDEAHQYQVGRAEAWADRDR